MGSNLITNGIDKSYFNWRKALEHSQQWQIKYTTVKQAMTIFSII